MFKNCILLLASVVVVLSAARAERTLANSISGQLIEYRNQQIK